MFSVDACAVVDAEAFVVVEEAAIIVLEVVCSGETVVVVSYFVADIEVEVVDSDEVVAVLVVIG